MSESFLNDIEFNKLCSGCDDVDLVDVMLELAADAYPELDRTACHGEISRLRQAALERLDRAGGPLSARLEAMGHLLFFDERFQGNRQSYYDPRNSYLNEVLNRRLGIPITLGIVYMAVAAGAELAVYGVPAPGHFMLTAGEGRERLFIDPFNQGAILDREALHQRFVETVGPDKETAGDWMRLASNFEITVRVLRNLKAAYAMDDQWSAVLPVQQRIYALLPNQPDEKRDLALVFLRNGKPHPALELLSGYMETCDKEAASLMQPYLRTARKMVAELN